MSLILFILIVPALFTIPFAFCWKQFKAAGEKGGKIIVKGISNDIRTVFMMTGFLNLFQIEE